MCNYSNGRKHKTLILLWGFLVFLGCGLELDEPPKEQFPNIKIDMSEIGIHKISDGLYEMSLNKTKHQSIQRLQVDLYTDRNREHGRDLMNTITFEWESSHYWFLGDTLGYVVNIGLNDNLEYVNIDTNYIVGFSGTLVPTINQYSLPTKVGDLHYEVNTMIAPIRKMIGDTMMVDFHFIDLNGNIMGERFGIVLK